MGLSAYRFSLEWARIEPNEGVFSEPALAHYGAIIERCRERGLTPVVTFNHFTCPHWFARRGGWLDPRRPTCSRGTAARSWTGSASGIAVAVTLYWLNLPRLLSWIDLPEAVPHAGTRHPGGRERGRRRGPPTGFPNVVLPEEFDAMADGLSAVAHAAAKAAIKARRPDLPVGLSPRHRRRPGGRPGRRRGDGPRPETGRGVRAVAAARPHDDFLGVQNYERAPYDANGGCRRRPAPTLNQLGAEVYPLSLAGAVRYAPRGAECRCS